MKSDHLRLALPFDVLTDATSVHLVAGEDFRVSLHDVADPRWVAQLMQRLAQGATRADLYSEAHPSAQVDALLDQLIGERVVVIGPPGDLGDALHAPGYAGACEADVVSSGDPLSSAVREQLQLAQADRVELSGGDRVEVFCQADLNYAAALEQNRAARRTDQRWLWASSGPRARAFVGPVFLPSAGPCFACILEGFRRLSEAPELYEALIEHAEGGGQLCAAQLEPRHLRLVADLVAAKLAAFDARQPSAFRLHVLELSSLEVTSYELWAEPECSECRER